MNPSLAQLRRVSTGTSRSARDQDAEPKTKSSPNIQQKEESSETAAGSDPFLENAIELAISVHFVRLLMAMSRGDFEDGSVIVRGAFALTSKSNSLLMIALCKFWQGVLFDGVNQKIGACQCFLGAFELIGTKRLETIFMLEYLQREWETASKLLENAAAGDEAYTEETKNMLWENITKTLAELNSFQRQVSPATRNELRSPLIKTFADNHSPLHMSFDPALSLYHSVDRFYDMDEKTSSSLFRFLHDEIRRDLAPLTPDLVEGRFISATDAQSPAQIPLPNSPFMGKDVLEKQFKSFQV